MQTFLIGPDPKQTAKILDSRRLGKQRVEAVQIANTLLGINPSKAWQNHPAVLMWKGYENYLINVYLKDIMNEWVSRGYDNTLTGQHYKNLCKIIQKKNLPYQQPKWFCLRFFVSHKSNLLRKDYSYYRQFWPHIPDNLEYWWPTKNGF